MKFTETPEIVTWPEMHYIYIEKAGPFQETAQACWQELHKVMSVIAEHNKITGSMALYWYEPNNMIYRAGMSVSAPPTKLPPGVQYTQFKSDGKYAKFTLTGPYSEIPAACGRAFDIMVAKKLEFRKDFGIENYVNDPRTTPEDQLITEILVPTKAEKVS